MNEAELRRNGVLRSWKVWDLNAEAEVQGLEGFVGGDNGGIDAVTCVVSIDYLTKPVEVLRGVRTRTKSGGTVHLVISNRCFPTKAVAKWLRVNEEERLLMVGDYLWFAGWRDIEIVTVCDGSDSGVDEAQPSGLQALARMMGMRGSDPLWVVRGKNIETS